MWKWEAEGDVKAVVGIVHGAYENHEYYAWFIENLRKNGFHIIAGDLPGHRMPKHVHKESFSSYMTYVEKLVKVCEAEQLPFFLIGHGLGGTLLLRLLQQDKIPCAGVILTSPWLSIEYPPENATSLLSKIASTIELDHRVDPKLVSRHAEHQMQMRNDPNYSPIVTAGWYRELQTVMKTILYSERPFQNVPIALLVAGEDHITDPEVVRGWLMKKKLDEIQFKKWANLRHDLIQEPEREQVYYYIEAFMHNVLRSLGYVIE